MSRPRALAIAVPRLRTAERAGIPLQLDMSCLAAVALGAWTWADAILPLAAPERSVAAYWGAGLATAAALITCVAAHEVAHCIGPALLASG